MRLVDSEGWRVRKRWKGACALRLASETSARRKRSRREEAAPKTHQRYFPRGVARSFHGHASRLGVGGFGLWSNATPRRPKAGADKAAIRSSFWSPPPAAVLSITAFGPPAHRAVHKRTLLYPRVLRTLYGRLANTGGRATEPDEYPRAARELRTLGAAYRGHVPLGSSGRTRGRAFARPLAGFRATQGGRRRRDVPPWYEHERR